MLKKTSYARFNQGWEIVEILVEISTFASTRKKTVEKFPLVEIVWKIVEKQAKLCGKTGEIVYFHCGKVEIGKISTFHYF